jgi:hypothetical protein
MFTGNHIEEIRNAYKILLENLNRRDLLADLHVCRLLLVIVFLLLPLGAYRTHETLRLTSLS